MPSVWFLCTLVLLFLSSILTTEARRSILPRNNSPDLSQYGVPLSNGSVSLPPPTGHTIKAIALGRGTQNYTCSSGSTAAPVPVGAIAELFDASTLLPIFPVAQSLTILDLIASYIISFDLSVLEHSNLPIIGRHHFDASAVPIFDLGQKGFLRGKKAADIAAPANASKGPYGEGHGAVDWLELCAIEGSVKLQRAYRVETAGGKPPHSCEGQPQSIKVDYAAQYWFYE